MKNEGLFLSCLLQGEHNHITGYCKKNPCITPIFASQIKALILQVYIHKYSHNFRPIQAKINWEKKVFDITLKVNSEA